MYIDPPPFYDARIPFNHPIFCLSLQFQQSLLENQEFGY